ncbi:MAG: aminoacyl-tRNA hydrolase, partial [Thiohalobacterales bacterium]|nr:aminoacyl-tRNA hydrolase [Thiohalobacterales bacterium]
NPGSKYEQTRHNAGFWFVDAVARQCGTQFRPESKYKSETARCSIGEIDCRLQKPMDYINRSGMPVASLAGFYRIPRTGILVAHDDLDLPPGTVRLKRDGGHGGHNGLRDLIPQLGGKDFFRLRIGIGHPGHRDDVVGYVLKAPSSEDRALIESAIERAIGVLPDIVNGNIQHATKILHTIDKAES